MNGFLPDRPLFEQLRYDAILEPAWLERLGFRLDVKTLSRLRRIDDPASVALAYAIGQKAAEQQVLEEHFAGFNLRPAERAVPAEARSN